MGPRPRAVAASVLAAVTLLAPAAADARWTPDPLRHAQEHLLRDGGIDVSGAWRLARSARTVIAVVDSGVDLGHPDLRRNLWANPGEVAGNGVDDDGNGHVDDVHGVDVVDRDGTPQDEHGHGTHVAGVAAARGGNGRGVSGVAPRARIMAVRVLDDAKSGTVAGLAEGIGYAIDEGAAVINVSVNADATSPALDAAIDRAAAAGVLIVASAGNDGRDLGARPSFPACSSSPNVVAVGFTDTAGEAHERSNRGACVATTAPGEDVLATTLGGGYGRLTGSSQATPQVAGTAALLLGRGRLDVVELKRLLGARRGALSAGASLRSLVRGLSLRNIS